MRSHIAGASVIGALIAAGSCATVRQGTEGLLAEVPISGDSVVVLAAGDIADCARPGAGLTAALLDTLPGYILVLGDNAYWSGSEAEYQNCYAPTWGRHLSRTLAAAGNHDYRTPGASSYFAYFGARAGERGRGYYAADLGGWRLLVLNSGQPMQPGSEQERWLREELSGRPSSCSLAVIHHPRFSSGVHGSNRSIAPLWRALQEAGVELMLSGHDHIYERFLPMTADGVVDPAHGVRQFVVGTGGARHTGLVATAHGSVTRLSNQWGVLRLRLRAASYEWDFITAPGGVSLDHGGDRCH